MVLTIILGTFLCNCEKERIGQAVKSGSPSLWAFVNSNSTDYLNRKYKRTDNVLVPASSQGVLRLWRQYYLRYNRTMLRPT